MPNTWRTPSAYSRWIRYSPMESEVEVALCINAVAAEAGSGRRSRVMDRRWWTNRARSSVLLLALPRRITYPATADLTTPAYGYIATQLFQPHRFRGVWGRRPPRRQSVFPH